MYKVTHYARFNSILFVLLVAGLIGCDFALAEDDFVYGPEFAMSGPMRGSVKWALSLEPKITSDAQQAGEIALVGGVCWNPTDYLAITPEFMYVTKGSSADSNESRPRLGLELSGTAGVCKIALRNRFEYRMKEGADEYWRYSVRVKLTFPKIAEATPFVYEELLYEFGDKDELNGNEAGLGFGLPLADDLGITVDLRFCHSKSEEEWGTGDVQLITTFKYSF
ncbi:MAG: DUF2490 domain-containing protein [Desulfobacterales bacterium]|nr:DUF2490 domain-containing protein [Desulfobacterales bacterium]